MNKSAILVDCGNGTMSRLQRYCRIEDLEAIVISHLHDDHIGDLRILRYAIETKKAFKQFNGRVKIFMPQSPTTTAQEMARHDIFDIEYIHDGMVVKLHELSLEFALMKHSIESYAISVEKGQKRLVYTADTVYNEKIISFSENADLLISEATFADLSSLNVPVPHMDALHAGLVAKGAEVKKLLLTHFWYEEDIDKCVEAARQNFSDTWAAEELKKYSI
jgi:ribonuclease BN (tRNA processing enzyme)